MTWGSHDLQAIIPSKGMPEAIRRGSLVDHPCLQSLAIPVHDVLTKSKICIRCDRYKVHARTKRSRGLVRDYGVCRGEGKVYGILVSPAYSSAEHLEISNSSVKS